MPKKLGKMAKASNFGILRNPWFLNKDEVADSTQFGSMLDNSHWLEALKGMVSHESSKVTNIH